jgi:voltage-gated potassium channel
MTTLSTVGYGDLYPNSDGGRIVAMLTMIFGIGVLGTLAGTISNAFLEVRERARRGERSYTLSGHLLVLGWNDKSRTSIEDFRHDPRYADTTICIVAELEHTPIEDKTVKFVRGVPGQREVLERASAEGASAALVFARDPLDGRSDHETALTILALRRLNPHVRISAELVDPGNREHLEDAGCSSVIDLSSLTSTLIARSVQDVGISELVSDLLTNKRGSEIYRVPVDDRFVGGTYGQYVSAMVERNRSVLGILRQGETTLHPAAGLVLQAGDEAFVVAAEPP